jgi:PAS domain S-box-containing protein
VVLKPAHDQTEQRPKDYKQLLTSILDATADGILVGHSDGSFSFANRRFAEMWRIPEDVLETKDRGQLHKVILGQLKDPEAFMRDLERLYRSTEKYFDTVEFKDGRLLERYSEPLYTDGEISGRVWSFRDVTRQKQSEAALRESEARFRQLAEMLPETIFEIDKHGTLTYANQKAFEHFNYNQTDFEEGLNAFDMIVPEERDKARENVRRILNGEDLGLVEYRALRKDGSIFPAMFHSTPIMKHGKPVGLRGFIIDIAKQKEAEQEKSRLEGQLAQAQRMEAIGTLAGGIAHDFNNILGAIMGYTELSLLDTPDSSPARSSLNQVLKAVNRAKDVVNQILAFSRQTKEADQPIRIGPVIKEALKLLRATLPATIEIRQRIEKESGTIVIDPSQIHQVIMNLCTNAAHAMRETGGVLEVKLEALDLAPKESGAVEDLPPGPYAKMTVSDTGHGFPPEIKCHIFDPYFTTKEKGVGTGLGLSVVYGIVQSHGGAIEVVSESGKGTTFEIYLPQAEAAIEEKVEPTKPLPLGDERVFFIDDEETLVEIGKKMLGRLGYQVTTRTSPREALEAFQAHPGAFDLVITDQTMPGMTGERLARRLMQIRPDIPVILCSGFSEVMDENRARAAGIRAYVMKPLVMSDMAKTIRQVLDEEE